MIWKPVLVAGLGMALAFPAQAFDAGGFAMQQHYHSLMDQQSGGQGAGGSSAGGSAGTISPGLQSQIAADLARIQAEHRALLEPQYRRMVQQQGKPAADRWLAGEAARLGQEAAVFIREKYGLGGS